MWDLEGAHECLVNGHHAAGVVELPAVVRGGEQGHLHKVSDEVGFHQTYVSSQFLLKPHQLTLGEKLVTILHHLGEKKV